MNMQHKLASVLIAVALSLAIAVPSVLADYWLEQLSPNPTVYVEHDDF